MVRRNPGRVSEEDRQADARVGDAHNAMVAQEILKRSSHLKNQEIKTETHAIMIKSLTSI